MRLSEEQVKDAPSPIGVSLWFVDTSHRGKVLTFGGIALEEGTLDKLEQKE